MEYTLEKLEVYNLAEKFSDDIWNIVVQWGYFNKDTIGKQLVRAADSISANIAKGYGRYFTKKANSFIFIQVVFYKKMLLMLNPFIKFVRDSQETNSPTSREQTNKPIN